MLRENWGKTLRKLFEKRGWEEKMKKKYVDGDNDDEKERNLMKSAEDYEEVEDKS